LCRSAYVTVVRFDAAGARAVGSVQAAADNESDLLTAVGDRDLALGLRVGTTARSAVERALVQQHLQKMLFGRSR
jgi:hypothetical protein